MKIFYFVFAIPIILLIIGSVGFFILIVAIFRRYVIGSPPFDLVISINSLRVCVILSLSKLCTLDIFKEITSMS